MPSLSRGTTTGALLSIYLSFFLARPSFASTIGLPSEIVVFVPSCATACLSTFIDTNYPQGVCGTDPTFACLCAHTGSNGFTVGEGALACIASLDRTGQCTGTDVAATASQKAYSMCVGQSSAAAETHATIVATQVIPFQSQSTKTVTTTAAGNGAGDTNGSTDGSHTTEHTTARVTTSSSTSTSPHTSTTSTTSTRSPTYLTESTLITAPPRSSTTIAALPQTTSTSTSTKSASDTSSAQTGASPNQTQTQPNNKGVTSLSVGQIVGISVGTAAALFLAIAISLYLRVVRRRRLMLVPRLTGDSKQGQSHDSDEEGFRKRFRPRTGHELQISVPMNLQAPARARTSNSAWPSWQEKYKNIRRAQDTQPPQNTQYSQNTQAETRPEPPPKFDPPEVLITRPTLERTPDRERAGAPDTRNSRNLTPMTINGRSAPTQMTQTPTQSSPSPGRSDVPPSLLIRPPPPRNPARLSQQLTAKATAATTPRPVPYPSYYGITPDDEPLIVPMPTPRQPQKQGQERNLPAVFQTPLTNRDSIVTEFAEDGEDDLSPRTTDDGRYPSSSRRFSRPIVSQQQYDQPQPSPRLFRQPLPQFQIQPHHQPPLRPQPPPPQADVPQPFMSPSLVPRPLSIGPRTANTSTGGPITFDMPDGAGSNVVVSRMAKMRLGDERALGLRLVGGRDRVGGSDGRPQRPRQNAGWRRMDDNQGEY